MTCPRQQEFEEEQVALMHATGKRMAVTLLVIAGVVIVLLSVALYLESKL